MDVGDRVAVVTGSGNGIGRALASGFAAAGFRVAVADIDAAAAADTAAALRSMGAVALGLQVDVAEPDSVSSLIQTVVNEWRGLDVMVNNAGVFPRGRVLDLDLATWSRTIDVNLKGTFLGCQAAGRVLVRQARGGRIINVSSSAAFEPAERQAHYAASKAAIIAFSRDLALELAPHRITVNVLAPGLVNTAQPRQDDVTEEQLAARGAAIPLGRMAEPQDMVPSVLFLCGEGGAYITGQTLHVNGGLWMP